MDGDKLTKVFTSQAYRALVEESKERIARGAARRAAMKAQIEAGITPMGPRADYLNRTSHEIFEILCAAAERFNRDFPDDILSVSDQLDALMTCRRRLLDGVAVFQIEDGTSNG